MPCGSAAFVSSEVSADVFGHGAGQ